MPARTSRYVRGLKKSHREAESAEEHSKEPNVGFAMGIANVPGPNPLGPFLDGHVSQHPLSMAGFAFLRLRRTE